jgi:hypothetical protein
MINMFIFFRAEIVTPGVREPGTPCRTPARFGL